MTSAMGEETPKRNTDCVYFLASPLTCKKGSSCEYRHSESARLNPRDCRYWLAGNCLLANCSFRHPPLDGRQGPLSVTGTSTAAFPSVASFNKSKVPCYFFSQGYCARGTRCSFLHVQSSLPGREVPNKEKPPKGLRIKVGESSATPGTLGQENMPAACEIVSHDVLYCSTVDHGSGVCKLGVQDIPSPGDKETRVPLPSNVYIRVQTLPGTPSETISESSKLKISEMLTLPLKHHGVHVYNGNLCSPSDRIGKFPQMVSMENWQHLPQVKDESGQGPLQLIKGFSNNDTNESRCRTYGVWKEPSPLASPLGPDESKGSVYKEESESLTEKDSFQGQVKYHNYKEDFEYKTYNHFGHHNNQSQKEGVAGEHLTSSDLRCCVFDRIVRPLSPYTLVRGRQGVVDLRDYLTKQRRLYREKCLDDMEIGGDIMVNCSHHEMREHFDGKQKYARENYVRSYDQADCRGIKRSYYDTRSDSAPDRDFDCFVGNGQRSNDQVRGWPVREETSACVADAYCTFSGSKRLAQIRSGQGRGVVNDYESQEIDASKTDGNSVYCSIPQERQALKSQISSSFGFDLNK